MRVINIEAIIIVNVKFYRWSLSRGTLLSRGYILASGMPGRNVRRHHWPLWVYRMSGGTLLWGEFHRLPELSMSQGTLLSEWNQLCLPVPLSYRILQQLHWYAVILWCVRFNLNMHNSSKIHLKHNTLGGGHLCSVAETTPQLLLTENHIL